MIAINSYISIFFLKSPKLVHCLARIVNKSQTTLNNRNNMNIESQKREGKQLQHSKNSVHYPKCKRNRVFAFHFNGLGKKTEEIP